MPLYDYVCDSCQHRFERRHGFNETVTECPECGQPVRRVLHPTGVVFKGSGWYITDSRKGESENSASIPPAKSDAKTEAKADGKAGEKSETKTETKSESKPAEPKPVESKPAESKSSNAA